MHSKSVLLFFCEPCLLDTKPSLLSKWINFCPLLFFWKTDRLWLCSFTFFRLFLWYLFYFHLHNIIGFQRIMKHELSINLITISLQLKGLYFILPLCKDILRHGHNTRPNLILLSFHIGTRIRKTPGPFGWIFWTMTSYNLKKFTSRSI